MSTPFSLRDYQKSLKDEIYSAWQGGAINVIAVAPTGAGKTEIKAAIFNECRVPGVAIAHRQELVLQISNAIARSGTYHRIIAPKALVNFCVSQQIKLFGKSFVNHQSPMAVAGVDTLLARQDDYLQWCNQVKIWDIDEGHHVLRDNKWGKAVSMFPHAVGVGFTATPIRADKKGIARQHHGVFDRMVIGPSMRELIDRKYLSEYRIYGPPASINTKGVDISASTGDFNLDQLRKAAHKSEIVGDVVEHYLRLAPGKLGITFCVDVDIAVHTAEAYRQRGVPAEVVSAKTPDAVRVALMEKFRARQILQLVNVDLFGEGVDVPGVEVVSMGRPTQSLGLYMQQFGRLLRVSNGKTHGILIDHVSNVKLHGLPDKARHWTLDLDEIKRRKNTLGEIPITTCTECFQPREATIKQCPYCGHIEVPTGRSSPDQVDGDLIEYGPELLHALGREIRRVDGTPEVPRGAAEYVAKSIHNRWQERQEAQQALRDCIALWAGVQHEVHDRSMSESYRRFYYRFGVDVMTAQTLGRPEAEKLTNLIRSDFV